MDRLDIVGPTTLKGSVRVSASKNATLPILAATLMTSGSVTFSNLPKLIDVSSMLKLLSKLGVGISYSKNKTILNCNNVNSYEATYDLVRKMRASFFVLGPLLARFGQAKISMPGGCAIGARPVNIHLDGLKKMGAKIKIKSGYVEVMAEKLRGAEIVLPFPSVGASENLLMAASLANGQTVIKNAAKEPEIVDLAHFINKMGGKIEGAGNDQIVISGVKSLKGVSYSIIPDRIEAATYIMAAVMTNSKITIENIIPNHLSTVLKTLEDMGAKFKYQKNCLSVLSRGDLKGIQVDTAPYPGFPTDIQAQLMALTTLCKTPSIITEHIFENRFMHVPELNRMRANIVLKGHSAIITPQQKGITGAPVMCTDLRASAALILAALVAKGKSEIRRIYHIDRGYDNIDTKLKHLGANIQRLSNGI